VNAHLNELINKMASHIYKCQDCKTYTMKETCPSCNKKTIQPRPPKYSPDDKYSKYRRQVKKEQLIKEDLL
jgi:H/ACA ribonucleoprotein complex subunit 3